MINDKIAAEALLSRASVGRIGTVNPDGSPYTVAVHFVYAHGVIYIHGRNAGQKLSNINMDCRVCFEVDELHGLLTENIMKACAASAEYESVVISGDATVLENYSDKLFALTLIADKYSPANRIITEENVRVTAVTAISIKSMTYKAH